MSLESDVTRIVVNHSAYNVAGLTDIAVMSKQAETRRDKMSEVSVVHDHAYYSRNIRVACNPNCKIFIPGHHTISWLDFKAGANPSKMEADE